MRNAWIGVCLALLAGGLQAGNDLAARRQIEATMRVAGGLEVDDQGRVTAYTLDHPDALPADVTRLLAQSLPALRFEPVRHGGQAQAVHARMNLVVAARQVDPQHVAIRLRSAHFTDADLPASERMTMRSRIFPRYPDEAALANVGGAVYVAVRVNRSGHVQDAQVQQVNLFATDSPPRMRHWRDLLGKVTLSAVRRATFAVPSTGPHADDASFTGILPVVYRIGPGPPRAGQWEGYVPGPRAEIPWLDDARSIAFSSEAIPAGVFAQTGTGLKLLTPIDGG